jgi:2',3'-cyclic-nucleotide 2'-phosphodiesterase (5'-nucleotidase family)
MRPSSCVVSLAIASWLALLGSCSSREQGSPAQVAKRAQPALRLVALTDVSGYLEPCGCQSKLLGGIDRAAAKLQALRAERIPVLFVAAGDLLFGDKPEGSTADTDATTQETWKAQTLVEIFDRLGLAAATPGKRDLSFGRAELARLQAQGHFSWLPAQPASEAAAEGVAGKLTRAGELKVGLLGVSTFGGPDGDLSSERLRQLQAAAQGDV